MGEEAGRKEFSAGQLGLNFAPFKKLKEMRVKCSSIERKSWIMYTAGCLHFFSLFYPLVSVAFEIKKRLIALWKLEFLKTCVFQTSEEYSRSIFGHFFTTRWTNSWTITVKLLAMRRSFLKNLDFRWDLSDFKFSKTWF